MSIDAIYGWAAVLVCAVACFSRSMRIEWMALLLLGNWLASNFLYADARPPVLLYYNFSSDTLLAALGIFVLYGRHARLLSSLVCIWAFLIIWHVLWRMWMPPHFFWYYVGCNVALALQLSLVAMTSIANRNRMATLRRAA